MKKIIALVGTIAAIVIMTASFMAPAFANPSHQVGANYHVALLTGDTQALLSHIQICNDDANGKCLNAWNYPNGSLVKSYSANVANDDFGILPGIGTQVTIQFDGPPGSGCDPFLNTCLVADNGNNKFDAKAGIGAPGWWGVSFNEFTSGCPAGEFTLQNYHWQGNMFAGQSNGDQVYLNNSGGPCLAESTF